MRNRNFPENQNEMGIEKESTPDGGMNFYEQPKGTAEKECQFHANTLYLCDNLCLMKRLPGSIIDLIYVDPPFFTGKERKAVSRIQGSEFRFQDTWSGGIDSYVSWLKPRLTQMRRLLKPRGLIYLHLDWHAVHYAKVAMDSIFSYDRFVNEIIWRYRTGGVSINRFSRKHDTILVYSKSAKFRIDPWKEKAYTKCRYRKAGLVNYGAGKSEFFEDGVGVYNLVNATDVWEIPYINSQAKERVGYPSQKPQKLMEKIISTSTRKGDLVADFFCGSGTTGVVAQSLGRKWILSDQSIEALKISKARIKNIISGQEPSEKTLRIPILKC